MAAETKAPERKQKPSDQRKQMFYLSDAAQEEIMGAENRSQRLDDMARGYAVMRRSLCPALPIQSWSAVMGALRTPIPRGVEAEEIASVIADRMSLHEQEIADRLGIDAKGLIRKVRGWSPATAWAVADSGWRFWRLSEQLGVRQKLALLGIEPAA